MQDDCGPKACERFALLNTAPAMRYQVCFMFLVFDSKHVRIDNNPDVTVRGLLRVYRYSGLFYQSSDQQTLVLVSGFKLDNIPGVRGVRGSQGLFHFPGPVLEEAEVWGTYIYPDWLTCVSVGPVHRD